MSERPIITVTEAARAVVGAMRAAEPDGDELALRVSVIGLGEGGHEYAYELVFDPIADAKPDDELHWSAELPVIVPEDSVDKLWGAVLDNVEPTGLVIRNPNRPRPEASTPEEIELTGSPEEKLRSLLAAEINPSLAMHGGFADVDRVEGDIAYITMGGGCQGCGLAALTLTEGIKATIEKRIPEITEVVDVTDHASGANPFYEAAK